MNTPEKSMRCKDVAPLLVFYACEEVSDKERQQIETHLSACADCSAQLAEEQALCEAVSSSPQPADEIDSSGIMLAQCRSELAEALDDLAAPPASLRQRWHPFGWTRQWMAQRPVWSGAVLVLFGILLGAQILPWLQVNGFGGMAGGNSSGQTFNVMAAPQLSDEQLSKMTVAGINLTPAPDATPANVQVQLTAQQPLVLAGNLEDTNVRRVLVYVVANGDHANPGVRLDCLDALKTFVNDEQVREALLKAVRKDPNPAVRLKALESLRDSSLDDPAREALLDALEHDDNPGVRVEAVNLLARSIEGIDKNDDDNDVEARRIRAPFVLESPGDRSSFPPSLDPSIQRVVHTLEELQRRDPSRYVRLRSADALRQIGPREVH